MRAALTLGAVALSVLLAGCTAPLTSADLEFDLTTSETDDLIVGDELEIVAGGTVPEGRESDIVWAYEVRTDGGEWKRQEGDLALDEAGEWEARAIAVTTAEQPESFAGPSITFVVHDLEAMVRELYYEEGIAFQTSTTAGVTYQYEHTYPGLNDPSEASAVALRNEMVEIGYGTTPVPDLSTLAPDPTWLPKMTKAEGNACAALDGPITEPLPGRTFILAVDSSDWNIYGSYPQSRNLVHVTLLDGEIYFYYMGC